MSRTLHLFGTVWCAMMVPIQVIRWYRMQCYDGTDSCATVVPIRRYCHYISQKLFDFLFEDGIQLVTGLRVNMKNKLMPFYDRMMLRKRYIIETINDMQKNTAQIVHSRHRSVSNFIMNLISALGAYCFFDNKPKALQGYCIEDTKQLTLF